MREDFGARKGQIMAIEPYPWGHIKNMKWLFLALFIFWPILAWADEPICFHYSEQVSTSDISPSEQLEQARSLQVYVDAQPAQGAIKTLGTRGVIPPSSPGQNTPSQPPASISSTCPASSYDWHDGGSLDEFPQSAMGILIFEMADGGLGSCSASLVGPNLALTAGHCLYWGGAPHKKVRFIPGYRDGKAPFGTFYATKGWVWRSWAEQQNWGRDIGIIRLKDDIGNRFGWLGMVYNHDPAGASWVQYGYPSANQFQDHKRLVQSLSSYGYRANCGSPNPVAVGSVHTSGSSGGPWILNSADGPYVNGINSARLSSCYDTIISPVFDDSALVLFEAAQNN
jgi:hypothetical protein